MSTTQISTFLTESVVYEEDSEDGLNLEALYGLYISWCLIGNKVPIPDSTFRTAVRIHGLRHEKRDGLRFYPGLRMVGNAARDYVVNSVPEAYEVTVPPMPVTDEDAAVPSTH